jgi:hypothetical protein
VVITANAPKHHPTNQLTEQQSNHSTIQNFKQGTNQVTTKSIYGSTALCWALAAFSVY